MNYLDLLNKSGPTPAEIAKKEREEEQARIAKEKAIKEGAKEEIKNLQGRVAELKENPEKTHNRPYSPEDYHGYEDRPQKFLKVKDPKDKFDCAVHEVAKILMHNAEDEAEATQGYTDQMKHLQYLKDCCVDYIHCLNKKVNSPEGPESRPYEHSPAELKAQIDYYQKILAWTEKELTKTQEKISDELSHNSALIAAYVEFTGIKVNADDAKASAKVIADTAK